MNSVQNYLIYIVVIFILFICSYFDRVDKRSIWGVLSYTLLILLAIFRYGVGDDYFTYMTYFTESSTIDRYILFTSSFEPISYLLLSISRNFFFSPWLYFALFSCFTMLFIKKSAKVWKLPLAMVLLFYVLSSYYFMSFNQIRQALAMSVVLFSTKYILETQFLKYIMWIVIAAMIHNSAIVFVLIYPLVQVNLSKKSYLFIWVGTIIFSSVVESFMLTILSRVEGLSILHYLQDSSFLVKNNFAILKYIIPNIIFLISVIFIHKFKDKAQLALKLFALMIFYYNIFFGKNIFIRLGMYLDLFQVIFIPIFCLTLFKESSKRLGLYLMAILLFIQLWITIFIMGGQGVVPYKTFF